MAGKRSRRRRAHNDGGLQTASRAMGRAGLPASARAAAAGWPAGRSPVAPLRWFNTAPPDPSLPVQVLECRAQRHRISDGLLSSFKRVPAPSYSGRSETLRAVAELCDAAARSAADSGFFFAVEPDPVPMPGPSAGISKMLACAYISCDHQLCAYHCRNVVTVGTNHPVVIAGLRASGRSAMQAADPVSACLRRRGVAVERVVADLIAGGEADACLGPGLTLEIGADGDHLSVWCDHPACADAGRDSLAVLRSDLGRLAHAAYPGS